MSVYTAEKRDASVLIFRTDLAQVLATLHESKKALELAHSKYLKADEANKKLLEQLKSTAQQVDSLRMPTESKGGNDSSKVFASLLNLILNKCIYSPKMICLMYQLLNV